MRKLLGLLLLLTTMGANAQEIEFMANINGMMPMSYPTRTNLTGFSFEMRNDSAFVHLPYIGEVHTPTYSNEGLNFSEPHGKLSVKPTKKKDGKVVRFAMKHGSVAYRFNITLWDNHHIDIFMQPTNAQSCNYVGEWELPEKALPEKKDL